MIAPGIYRHYKGGEYRVLYVAKGQFKNDHDMEDMVIYETLAENPISQYWVRPLADFTETIEVDGKKVQRFTSV